MSGCRHIGVYVCGSIHDCRAMDGRTCIYPPAQQQYAITLGDELTWTRLSSRAAKNGERHHPYYSPTKPRIGMDYVMIERHLFDAFVRGVHECRSVLDTALSAVSCHRNGWIDNNSA